MLTYQHTVPPAVITTRRLQETAVRAYEGDGPRRGESRCSHGVKNGCACTEGEKWPTMCDANTQESVA